VTDFATALAAAFAPIASEYDAADVTEALSWAQSFVENYCNRTFDVVNDDVVVVDPYNNGSAHVPAIPVIDVSLVEALLPSEGGMTWVELTNFGFKKDTGLIYNTTGLPGTLWAAGGISWPWLPASLRVTYSHGFTTIPRGLIDASVRLGKQWLDNPGLRVQYRVGEIEERFNGSAGVTLNAMDQNILDRYSIESIA
jgi:hypothetical protein